MVAFAIRLTGTGPGDCWEDVDQMVPNRLVEQQLLDADLLREVSLAEQPANNVWKPFREGPESGAVHLRMPGDELEIEFPMVEERQSPPCRSVDRMRAKSKATRAQTNLHGTHHPATLRSISGII